MIAIKAPSAITPTDTKTPSNTLAKVKEPTTPPNISRENPITVRKINNSLLYFI